ncbi:MAG TPA: TetR/AcrR family transcriptional regulator [Steroidobacteraceae bacterium]|nr:TetR/AcrR family transcriptional regulator [Steroidobacteraceae bacterium]
MKRSDSKRRAILDAAYRLFRTRGFEKTSITEITAAVGGSKATIYSHFPSKEELFVECMMAAAENYIAGMVRHLKPWAADPAVALAEFGSSFLAFICSPEQLEVRRLMIAEAAHSGTGKFFFEKITELRAHVSAFLSSCMARGTLCRADPDLAADQLAALLEAEILQPLLLQAREESPRAEETRLAAKRAVAVFLRAYAPLRERIEPPLRARTAHRRPLPTPPPSTKLYRPV